MGLPARPLSTTALASIRGFLSSEPRSERYKLRPETSLHGRNGIAKEFRASETLNTRLGLAERRFLGEVKTDRGATPDKGLLYSRNENISGNTVRRFT